MNAIQISNVTIHQTESLYSLNDLHKASGSENKHRPTFWLQNQQTQDLIAEIEAQGKQAVQTVNGGSKRGTYVCRELVVSYGMWISAKFALQVIQVFLERQPSASEYLNETECARIRAAVKARCARTGETSQAVYRKLHGFMGVPSYEQIGAPQFQTALNFLSSMENAPALFEEPQGIVIGENDLYQLAVLTHYTCKMGELLAHIAEPLRLLGSDYSGRAYSLSQEPHSWACNVCDFLTRALPQMRDPKYSTRVQKILTGA